MECNVLLHSVNFIAKWFPLSKEELLDALQKRKYGCDYQIHEINSFTYCTFCFPIADENGRTISSFINAAESFLLNVVFVYDQSDELAADLAAYTLPAKLMSHQPFMRYLEEESDWLYWEQHILQQLYQEELKTAQDTDLVCIFNNAYTTKALRRHGLFRCAMEELSQFILRNTQSAAVYSALALDPDVACYGKDRLDTPYHYSMKDEPDRRRNAEIAEKFDFNVIHLETDEPVTDGSLLWFAYRKQIIQYI